MVSSLWGRVPGTQFCMTGLVCEHSEKRGLKGPFSVTAGKRPIQSHQRFPAASNGPLQGCFLSCELWGGPFPALTRRPLLPPTSLPFSSQTRSPPLQGSDLAGELLKQSLVSSLLGDGGGGEGFGWVSEAGGVSAGTEPSLGFGRITEEAVQDSRDKAWQLLWKSGQQPWGCSLAFQPSLPSKPAWALSSWFGIRVTGGRGQWQEAVTPIHGSFSG